MWSARTSHLEEWHTNVCACGSDSKDSDVTCECLCAWPCQLSARGRQGSPDPGLPTRLFPLHTGAHGFLGFVWPLRAQGYLGAHANPWVERVTSAPPVSSEEEAAQSEARPLFPSNFAPKTNLVA